MSDEEKKQAEEARPAPEQIEELKAKAEEYLDLARRAKADFLNYQDRVKRELESASRYAVEDFIREFLPALDAVRESLRSARAGAKAARLLQGIALIEKEFLRVLSKHGITPIETSGKTFDPAFHEVLAVVDGDGAAPNAVVEEMRRGWLCHDRVLRAALVKIARAPEPKPDAPQTESDAAAEKPADAAGDA